MAGKSVGKWVYLATLLVAVIAGLVDLGDWMSLLLVILGLVGGWLNIEKDRETAFFAFAIAFALFYGVLGDVPAIGSYLTAIFGSMLIAVGGAALAGALKAMTRWAVE